MYVSNHFLLKIRTWPTLVLLFAPLSFFSNFPNASATMKIHSALHRSATLHLLRLPYIKARQGLSKSFWGSLPPFADQWIRLFWSPMRQARAWPDDTLPTFYNDDKKETLVTLNLANQLGSFRPNMKWHSGMNSFVLRHFPSITQK